MSVSKPARLASLKQFQLCYLGSGQACGYNDKESIHALLS